MNDILLLMARFLAIWCLAGPLMTTLHELGHAAAALTLTRGDVHVWVGRWNTKPRWSLGRLHLALTYRPGFNCFYRYSGPASRGARAAIQAAGPLSSLATAAVVLGAGMVTEATGHWLGESVIVVCTYASFGQFLATAIPWRYPRGWGAYAGEASDGLRLLHTLRGNDTPSTRQS